MNKRLILLTFCILSFLAADVFAQGTPSPGYSIAQTVKRFDYPGDIPDSSGVGGDDVLAGYDLDKDGKGEIILITDNLAASQEGPAIIVFEATADNTYEAVWWFEVREHTNDNGSFPTLAVGDLDGDNQLEILAGIPYGAREIPNNPVRFYVFEVDTTVDNGLPQEPTATWTFEANPTDNTRPSAMDVYDVDGDGQQEVLMIFRAWNNGGNAFMIFSLVGDFFGGFTTFTKEFFDDTNLTESDGNIYDVHVHDVNGDGTPEISAVEWEADGIIAVFYQATGPDQYQMVHKAVSDFTFSAGALGSFLPWDIDGDGIEEFMMAGSDGQLYVVPVPNGDVKQITASSFNPINLYDNQIRGAAIGDFDDDGNVDYLIAGSYNKKIFRVEYKGSGSVTDANSYDFTTVYDDPNAGRYYYIAFPQDRKALRDGQTLVDMDGDNKRELVFTDQEDTALGDNSIYVTILESDIAVKVELPDLSTLPSGFELHQNFPNPFNPETVIQYDIPRAGQVKITVHNLLGETIATLVDEYKGLGTHRVTWNGKDFNGVNVPSGVYIYTIIAGDFKQSKQMTLLK